jgi:hypothetical protein
MLSRKNCECHAVCWKPTDVSEEHVAFTFRADEQVKQEGKPL